MINLIFQTLSVLFRWMIYLALIGELSNCTGDLKMKAGHSVQKGLINLGNLNRSLHGG